MSEGGKLKYRLRSPVGHAGPKIDYAAALNEQQLAAATAPAGPCLVLAGAGSGKTRTLIYRLAYLAEQGLDPSRILLLTFTNKAAKEMLRRAAEMFPGDLSAMWGGTFHSVGHRMLRRHAEDAGLIRDFTIMDRADSKDLLAASYTSAGLDIKDKKFPKPDAALELFSFAVNTRRTLEDLLEGPYAQMEDFSEGLERLHLAYVNRKRQTGSVDYDDLLTLPLKLLEEHPAIAEEYRTRWQSVLVDEFQDTNPVQSAFVHSLVEGHRNLMVVGDDAQSIYSWRGADFENILSFPQKYPDALVIRVEFNYRSTQEILALANASIGCNRKQFPKELRAVRPGGGKPVLVGLADSRQQALFVAQRIEELQEEGVLAHEVAVLYRAHSHAIELQMELTRRNIPFQITSGIPFFEQAHIKDVAAFLRAALNPEDELAFKRIAKLLPGIGARTAEKIWQSVRGQAEWDRALAPKKGAADWLQVCDLISQMRASLERPADEWIQWVMEAVYEAQVKILFDNYHQRLDDIRQLQEFSRQYANTSDFLSQLALLTNVDAPGGRGEREGEPAVRLCTVHQAKGLEWPHVFVVMLCDGLFPLGRCCETEAQLEEERRLFYVAATRAMDRLYLTYPVFRFGRGSVGMDCFQQPSRFIVELPSELYDRWDVEAVPGSWGSPSKAYGQEGDPF